MVVENSIHGYDRQNDHVRRIGDYLGPDFNCDALTNLFSQAIWIPGFLQQPKPVYIRFESLHDWTGYMEILTFQSQMHNKVRQKQPI